MDKRTARKFGRQARRYLITGILTVIPIWITWWVFNFFFTQLSQLGAPAVRGVSRLLRPHAPGVADFLIQPAFQTALAVVITLVALYGLGWLTSKVLGRKLLELFDSVMDRIPLVERIYGSTRKLLSALQKKPESVERVVLINFPSPEMKAVGFVTRTFEDADTGQRLAAVYVPTTPNPTSGYMEIVPLDQVTSTDWTMDEAFSFIISGGTIAPPNLHYSRGAVSPARPAQPPEED